MVKIKNMKLKTNTISAKLYRWFYFIENNEMPKSLCVYFWKLMLMWVFILPYFLITIPYHLMYGHLGKIYDDRSDRIMYSLVIWFVLFILCCMIFSFTLFYTTFNEHSTLRTFQSIGILGWVIGIIFLIVTLIRMRLETISEKRWNDKNKQKEPSIIKEFIKAKYNKYCPKIDWE